jgi:hypothetical protein
MFIIINKSTYFDQIYHFENKKNCLLQILFMNDKNLQIKYEVFMINKNIILSIQ